MNRYPEHVAYVMWVSTLQFILLYAHMCLISSLISVPTISGNSPYNDLQIFIAAGIDDSTSS